MLRTNLTTLVLFLVLTNTSLHIASGQNLKSKTLGTVKVSIPSIHYVSMPHRDSVKNESEAKVFLRGANTAQRIEFVGRKVVKNALGNEEHHVDEYEIAVSPGIYRVVLPDFKNHRTANFQVVAGDLIKFQIPVIRMAAEQVCRDNIQILKTFDSETPLDVQRREYSLPPYSKIRFEVVKVAPPFEMTISYCSKVRRKGEIIYSGVNIYYQNYFISARTVIVTKEALELKPTSADDESVYVEKNGAEVSIPRRRISFR